MTLGSKLTSFFALAAGAIFPLALAPFFFWPLGLVSLAGLFWLLTQADSTKAAFRLSWLFGFGQFAVGVSWVYVSIHEYGGTPVWLAVPMVALFAGFLALIPACWFALRHQLLGQTFAWLTFPACWFLQEWCRSWLLTGFPWLFAGDAHLFTWLAGWAPIIGSAGISIIIALSASASIMLLLKRQPLYALPLLLWPIGMAFKQLEWTSTQGTMSVALVQGNVAQERKWLMEEILPTIQRYQDDTIPLLGNDLILWPETAITLMHHQYIPYMEILAEQAQISDSTVITGIPFQWQQGPQAGQFHNSIVAFGSGEGIYHKQRLVPFGEYIPLLELIRGWIPFFDLPMSNFVEGPADQPLLKVRVDHQGEEDLALVAPYICYEIAYPNLVRKSAQNADLLITISNDAWFGDSLGPKQHMALAQMRALETQRWLLRSTNNGISALVNHRGDIVEQAPTNQRTHLSAIAERRLGHTPYMQIGNWPSIIFALLASLCAFWVFRKQPN